MNPCYRPRCRDFCEYASTWAALPAQVAPIKLPRVACLQLRGRCRYEFTYPRSLLPIIMPNLWTWQFVARRFKPPAPAAVSQIPSTQAIRASQGNITRMKHWHRNVLTLHMSWTLHSIYHKLMQCSVPWPGYSFPRITIQHWLEHKGKLLQQSNNVDTFVRVSLTTTRVRKMTT